MTIKTPENTLSTTDQGDDMQRRLHYQAGCAALYGLKLLSTDSEFQEIFCEHHEDVLLKRKDGRFAGVQVKTRADGLELFKATDQVILSALARFVGLELQFPGQFERFVLATNGSVWQADRNGSNLAYLLRLAKNQEKNGADLKPLTNFITKLVKAMLTPTFQAQFSIERAALGIVIQQCLAKTYIEEEMPGLNDIEARLATRLSAQPEFRGKRHDEIYRAIKNLIQATKEAALLPNAAALATYVALAANPAEARTQTIIDGKRLTSETVRAHLVAALQADGLLSSSRAITVEDLPKGLRRMELKMSVGGLSSNNIELAKDLRASTETLLLEWLHKHGSTESNARYTHLHTLVRAECQEAYDVCVKSEGLFGEQLLATIRQRLRERHTLERSKIWGCRYEHLMGMASLLTEECKLWWSKEFAIPEETTS